MLEVTSISASSYDPESLTPMLDERVRDGWEIISIVSAGTKVVAFLQRDAVGSESSVADEAVAGDTIASAAAEEPAGWAEAPEDDSAATVAGVAAGAAAVAATSEPAVVEQPPAQAMPVEEAAKEPAQAPAAAETTPESAVPAGWYADPSGRFDLRYWDGNAWTEHVSRAGQQYTDPPVA